MEHLTDAMSAAAATPPPTAIDLDQLIADEHRNARRRRWGAGVGSALAVLLVAGAIAFLPGLASSNEDGGLRAGDPGGETKTEPPAGPRGSAAQRAEAQRLAQVLTEALTGVAGPASGWTVDGMMWEAQTGLTGNDSPLPGYTGGGNRVDGNTIDKIYLMVRRAPMPADTTCVKDAADDIDCTVQMRVDGSQLWQATTNRGGQFVRHVEVYRPDGTHIMVGDTAVGGAAPALSIDQLITLADTPALAPTVV
jgi:hypothetical protein